MDINDEVKPQLSPEKQAYLQEFGLFFEKLGPGRIAGLILGYLLVSDRAEVSFNELVAGLDASKASVHNQLKMLEQMGFVKSLRFTGDRKTYYRIGARDMGEMTVKRMGMTVVFVSLMRKGLELKENQHDDAANFLRDTAGFYEWLHGRMQELLAEWEQIRDQQPPI
ncbi:MAG: GbsR/MarR family transcriptional regulator [Bacteroidia bacterium]